MFQKSHLETRSQTFDLSDFCYDGIWMNKAEEILLHIGQPKTGTTTLQSTLFAAKDVLREQGILLPSMPPESGNAVLLAHSVFGHDEIAVERERWLQMDRTALMAAAVQAWENIKQEVATTPPKTLLISSEILFQPMNSLSIETANRQLETVAHSSKIIAYLRAPDAHFLSRMQQQLKDFSTDFLGSRTYNRDVILPLTAHWKGPVVLTIFDRQSMTQGDIVADFLTKFLPDVDPQTIPLLRADYNTTLSAEAMALLQDVTTGQLDWRGSNYALAVEILKLDPRLENPTKPKLSERAKQAVLNWHAPDLYWLRDQHGIVFPSIDYAALNENDVDGLIWRVRRVESICDVDQGRKAELLRRAAKRAKLPRRLRRLLYNYNGKI